jgi:hypothetical protein
VAFGLAPLPIFSCSITSPEGNFSTFFFAAMSVFSAFSAVASPS